ncbi:hypothetical protein [Halocynthiibacter sp.]|uniref:hypothetical protein n=1 Tax=Halocynthiibacter sp. TaxID=1979210 RepID=UPI003C378C16
MSWFSSETEPEFTGLFESLLALDSRSLIGALAVLAIGTLIALVGRVLSGFWKNYRAWRDRRRHFREVVIDILIHAEFDRKSVEDTTAPARLDALKTLIREDGDEFRPFIAFESDDPTWEDYRSVRRRLEPSQIVACDRFFDHSRLFYRYYEKLQSDAFVALSTPRKEAALDGLQHIGQDVLKSGAEMVQVLKNGKRTAKIYARIEDDLKKIAPASQKTEFDQLTESSETFIENND